MPVVVWVAGVAVTVEGTGVVRLDNALKLPLLRVEGVESYCDARTIGVASRELILVRTVVVDILD